MSDAVGEFTSENDLSEIDGDNDFTFMDSNTQSSLLDGIMTGVGEFSINDHDSNGIGTFTDDVLDEIDPNPSWMNTSMSMDVCFS